MKSMAKAWRKKKKKRKKFKYNRRAGHPKEKKRVFDTVEAELI